MWRVTFGLGVLVLGIAILIGVSPHLLLKIPRVGFILYAKLGGGGIPPYIDRSIYDHQQEWMNPNDVVVSVPAKSGTHWALYTMHLIRSKGNSDPFDDVYQVTPWPEFVFYPGQPFLERIEFLQNMSRKFPFSIFKTHLSPREFKVRDDVKYVVMVRNLFDAVASLRTFFRNVGPSFSRMWGGFPPGAGTDVHAKPEDWEQFIARNGGDGKPYVCRLINPIEGWWPFRKRSNVLFVHYSDRITDDRTQIARIVEFVGIDMSPEQVSEIARMVAFPEMKKVKSKVEAQHILDEFKRRGKVSPNITVLNPEVESPMMNAGPRRSGAEENTPSVNDALRKIFLDRFGPEICHWMEHGGELPMHAELPPRSSLC